MTQEEFIEVRRKVLAAAPVGAWARRLGVHRVSMSRCLALNIKCISMRERLKLYVESMERGEWKFVKARELPHRGRESTKVWSWVGEASWEREARLMRGFRVKLDENGLGLRRAWIG